jgi:hypothetical protein
MRVSQHQLRNIRRAGPYLAAALFFMVLTGFLVYSSSEKGRDRQTYLHTLEGLAFNKYLDRPIPYSTVTSAGIWDIYGLTAPEIQCVLGGDYGLMVHPGAEADKTVLWLQPGEECWPGHPCGGMDSTPTDENIAGLGTLALTSAVVVVVSMTLLPHVHAGP